VEVMQTSYKMDIIEAPSVAVCPFWPGEDIVRPDWVPKNDMVQAFHYGVDGQTKLDVQPYGCQYDRGCMCLNLFDAPKGPTMFHDFAQRSVQNIGTTGEKSENTMTFRERIEVRTNLTDPSPDKTLKVGFFDSVDPAPQWFYMTEGVWVLGSLELQTWTVSDLTLGGIKDTFTKGKDGIKEGMMKQRHIFRYTSQEVGARGAATESFVSYEMKNFFVDDTLSSETAFSPYALLYLLVLIAIRSAMVGLFINTMFPEYNPDKDKTVVREHSGASQSLSSWCFCCCCFPRSDGSAEKEPLLGGAP